jgi:hypothetical protein
MKSIDLREIQAVWRRLVPVPSRPAGYFTAGEISTALNRGIDSTRNIIRTLISSGHIETSHLMIPDMSGRPVKVPGYRFKGVKK